MTKKKSDTPMIQAIVDLRSRLLSKLSDIEELLRYKRYASTVVLPHHRVGCGAHAIRWARSKGVYGIHLAITDPENDERRRIVTIHDPLVTLSMLVTVADALPGLVAHMRADRVASIEVAKDALERASNLAFMLEREDE